MKYDLEERTAKFGENVIEFCKNLPKNSVNEPLIKQLIRSATSIGANYYEANGASSKSDFKNKIYICKKEAQETKFWLRMVAKSTLEVKDEAKKLWREAQEMTLIFSKIISSCKKLKIETLKIG
jgi:four helix bundle protein